MLKNEKNESFIYIRFQCIGRPSPCIRVVLPGEALHVNLTVLLLLLLLLLFVFFQRRPIIPLKNFPEFSNPSITKVIYVLTFNSNTDIPIPEAAAELANPTKWPLPMLLANSDAPTCVQD